jgi:selenocysteine lyase/cysteine desulfurase
MSEIEWLVASNPFLGSEGALPLPVQLACDALARQAEESPDKWKKIIRGPLTEATRQRLAPLLGTSPDELVFVATTSHSIDMVLNNFEWTSEDTIVYRELSPSPHLRFICSFCLTRQ